MSERVVVHVLLAGRALCGIAGSPSEWPAGNLWVSFADLPQPYPLCESCRHEVLKRTPEH